VIAGSRIFGTIGYKNVLYRVIQKLIEPERANRLAGKNFEKWVARYSAVLSKLPLVHCPRCLGSDVYLSRPHTEWDSILLPAPLRCHGCAVRFHKRLELAQLQKRSALGRSRWPIAEVLPKAEPRVPGILVVDDLVPFSKLIRETLERRGFAVIGARSSDEGMALFRAHQPQIDLAVIGLVMPAAGNLDLTADLNHLRPGLPVLYLVGTAKSIARSSIEAKAPGSVLAVPFTEEQLIARIGGLLNVEAAAARDTARDGGNGSSPVRIGFHRGRRCCMSTNSGRPRLPKGMRPC